MGGWKKGIPDFPFIEICNKQKKIERRNKTSSPMLEEGEIPSFVIDPRI